MDDILPLGSIPSLLQRYASGQLFGLGSSGLG